MARDLTDLHGQEESRTAAVVRDRAGHSDHSSPRAIELPVDEQEESQFLRTEKRVPVRRSALGKKTQGRLRRALAVSVFLFVCGSAAVATYRYSAHSWRFLLDSSDNIEISGIHNSSRAQIMAVLGADIGRNIFSISLSERKKQLEQVPWVETATVMRLLPNRLAIQIHERTPVAFARIGPKISLIDGGGVLLGLPANKQAKFSFPVIEGIGESMPLSSRAAIMRMFNRLVRELDAEGDHYSQDLSEVDLADTGDVKIMGKSGGAVLVHLGNEDFLSRYRLYVVHMAEWRQQVPTLQSVDLRFEGQVVVHGETKAAADGERTHGTPVLSAGKPGHGMLQTAKNQKGRQR